MKKNITTFILSIFILSTFFTPIALALDADIGTKPASSNTGSNSILNGGFSGQGNNSNPSANNGLGGQQSGGSGGGAGSACTSGLISSAAITGVIAALSVTANVVGVPTGNIATDLGSGFQSGEAFLDFLKVNCLDPAARAIYKKMLLQTEQSIFNWANNGFKGGPLDGNTFVNDVEGYFGSIRESATETWISDQDKNNPFYDEIVSAVYQNARSTNNDYTPDLAEAIASAECKTYQASQKDAPVEKSTGGGSGIGSLLNSVRGFFGGSNLPTNNPGFQNGGFKTPGSGVQLEGGTFIYNIFKTKAAFAQTSRLDSVVNNQDIRDAVARESGINSPSIPGVEAYLGSEEFAVQRNLEAGNPCNRKTTTAGEKRAVIAAYQSGQIKIAPRYEWAVLSKSFSANNSRDAVIQSAIRNSEGKAQNAQAAEDKSLSFNNGNTGVRTCVSFLPREEGVSDRPCRSDGWRTVTPGSLVANQVISALDVPLENVNKLTSNATFADVAQAVLNGLVNGLTSQLINSTNGLLSFSTKGSNSSKGEFTKGISTLSNTSAPTADVRTSISKTSTYVNLLEQNTTTLGSIVSRTEEARSLCSQILPLIQGGSGFRASTDTTSNHRCNIDPLTLDYKNDPTAGIKLSQNLLYKEVQQLDGTRGQRDQGRIALQNTQATLSALRRTESKYSASTDPNRESTFGGEIANLTISIPGDDSIELTRAQTSSLVERQTTMTRLVAELKAELAELK